MSTDSEHSTVEAWPTQQEARLARFETKWRSGVPPIDEIAPLVEDLPPDSSARRELLAELVKIDLENRWRRTQGKFAADGGVVAIVENYLRKFSELAGRESVVADLAVEEYRARHRWGDAPPHAEFAVRFPRSADELARRLVDTDKELLVDEVPAWHVQIAETRHGETMHPAEESPPTALGATRNHHVDFLWRVKPFSELPENVVSAIADEMTEQTFSPRDTLVRQGAAASSLIVVTEGDVEINLVDERKNCRVIDRAGRGTVLGEMSLVSNQPHSANVTAITAVKALVLPVENLHRIARQFPPLGAGFADLAAARLGRREVDVLYDKSIHGYRMKRRLGQGGMAIVYEAEEETTGRRVALKMMRPQLAYDLVAAKRFHHEAETLAALRHDNIVRVENCFAAHNTNFMVMELCEGPTLARLIERCPPLDESQVFAIVGQLAAALHHAHSHGVLHRDLKPGNVLILWNGVLKLSDFGLARSFLSTGLTVQGEILGTPRYMPPEQLIGTNVDQRADLYALGCIAYELFFGKPLYSEPDVTRLLALQLNWTLDLALAELARDNPNSFRSPSPALTKLLSETLVIDREQRTLNLEQTARLAQPIDVDLLWVAGMRR